MKSFLGKIAEVFIREGEEKLSTYTFVFPNRRSGQFFKKAIANEINHPVFLPSVITITDLFASLSSLAQADNIGLLFSLYDIHKKEKGSDESFDEFSFWGEMLLSDFDDIDKYLVDARLLYGNLASLKDIEEEFKQLNPEEQERLDAIRRFWQSFEQKSKGRDEFMRSWDGLHRVYEAFKQKLKQDGIAYQGMLFRDVVENLPASPTDAFPNKIVFVGFNALTKAEEALMDYLKVQGRADFYWDSYVGAITEPSNRAGSFIRKNVRRYPSKYTLYTKEELQVQAPQIDVISIASNLGQTKVVGSLLQELEDPGIETAVVLADEDHLVPMVQAVPSNVRTLNVTMGYPLKSTPIYAFFQLLSEIQTNFKLRSGEPYFHSRLVLRLINGHLISKVEPKLASLRERIINHNLIYLGKNEFEGFPLLSMIFFIETQGRDVVENFKSIFGYLLEKGSVDGQDDDTAVFLPEIEREYIFRIYTVLNRFSDLLDEEPVVLGRDVVVRMLSHLMETETIPFEGEPLAGLQLMGVLETRAIDFKQVYILGMNEGVFPKTSAANSYIPYNLRKGFGLPTIEDQDAIFAYYFYRLLQRAEKVTLVYNSVTEGLNGGEESRYIKQLKYLYHKDLHEKVQTYDLALNPQEPILITKNEAVQKKIDQFKTGGKRIFSASALATYLECPLKFYFGYVERLREPDEVHEDLDARLMGDVFHDVVEQFYKPFEGKPFDVNLLRLRLKNEALLEKLIRESFAYVFFKRPRENAESLKGKFVIYGNVVLQYLQKVITLDIEHPPIQYIKGEKEISTRLNIPGIGLVKLFGKIDRVDEVEEGIRILDYKTGSFGPIKQFSFKEMDALFERHMKDTNKAVRKAIFQTLYYALLYELDGNEGTFYPGIYYMRGLFSNVEPYIYFGERKQKKRVFFKAVKDEYVEKLKELIAEVFDVSQPFDQTTELKSCAYCEFRSICDR